MLSYTIGLYKSEFVGLKKPGKPDLLNAKMYALILLISSLSSCKKTGTPRFEYLDADQSGIHFSNDITENDSINILDFHYLYNGGGVGIGDFNKDGLPDICFTGNQVSSKLYLNTGNLQFKDISKTANFQTTSWTTGVAIADVNADGWQDIYLSVGGKMCGGQCKNKLFIHQGLDENGLPKFEEQAAEYGLEDGLYTQQAAFFDYDLDGDLDVYLLHNIVDPKDKNSPAPKHYIHKETSDQLLRNDAGENGVHPTFTDVSKQTGIDKRGYGLGIAIEDFNQDGYADIYIANDFISEDLLYLNQGLVNKEHQGFKEVSQDLLAHETYNSMGVDIADVNNDALPDIMVVDMLPAYHERQKTMVGFMNYDKFMLSQKQGYTAQFMRNTLQINNGFLEEQPLRFSDLGYMAGVYKTDWSWTPLLADFDNDGDRDMYITNGYVKDITDLDFVNYSKQGSTFGTATARRTALEKVLEDMKGVQINNYLYENTTSTTTGSSPQFTNRSTEWMKSQKSYSNGAVYSDLDNDGDLDIIVNNINDKAFVLQNTTNTATQHYLKIKLTGLSENSDGIGTKIFIYHDERQQYHFQSPQRGYLSSVDTRIHFGLGESQQIDSIKVLWQNGQVEYLYNVSANQQLEINIENGMEVEQREAEREENSGFLKTLKPENLIDFKQEENAFHDYHIQHLLLHQYSRSGPCFAVANIDNQPGEELFVGGAKGFAGQIFHQNKNGQYQSVSSLNSEYEDTDALFFDADNDGDVDLYVVSGGTEFKPESAAYQDRLYLNDGQGNFAISKEKLPTITASGSCVISADFDKDGDEDLFVGGRVKAHRFPEMPRSYLLENKKGKFTDITPEDLKYTGMITDAAWADIDKDGWQDLTLVGEWMPIIFFKNKKGKLERSEADIQDENGKKAAIQGLWNCLAAKDMDGDGDIDFIAGNQGLNTRLEASDKEPLVLFTGDYDKNGSPDPLVGKYDFNKAGERRLYPIHARDDVMKQVVKLKTRYQNYSDFSKVDFNTLLTPNQKNTLQVNQLQSCYFENKGNGSFAAHFLPTACQWAPIQTILADDFDQDGQVDVLLAGNDYSAESSGGWQDGTTGILLKKKDKIFTAIKSTESGFYVPGDVRDLIKIKTNSGQQIILAGQNSDRIKAFEVIGNW